MRFTRHGLMVMGLFLIVGCGPKVVKQPETDTKAIVPEYVINAKELLGIPLKESGAKLTATTDFSGYRVDFSSYVMVDREYGRTMPYFTETPFNPVYTYTLNRKAYLTLSEGLHGHGVGRVELTHSGVVSAEEAVMMLGYDPKQLIEHPVKHRNAERSDWFALIDPYFHFIEIQWFDATRDDQTELGKATQIRVSVW